MSVDAKQWETALRATELEFGQAAARVAALRLELERQLAREAEVRLELETARAEAERGQSAQQGTHSPEASEALRLRRARRLDEIDGRLATCVAARVRSKKAIRAAIQLVDELNNRRQLIRGVLEGARQGELRAAEELALEEGLALHRQQAGRDRD